METAKSNSLRPDDNLLHLLSVLPERAEQIMDFDTILFLKYFLGWQCEKDTLGLPP